MRSAEGPAPLPVLSGREGGPGEWSKRVFQHPAVAADLISQLAENSTILVVEL